MQIKRLSPAGCEELYRTALPRDFPAAECKPFAEVRRLLEAGVYEPLLLTDDACAREPQEIPVSVSDKRTVRGWPTHGRSCCRASGRRCWTILPCGVICAAAVWVRRRCS